MNLPNDWEKNPYLRDLVWEQRGRIFAGWLKLLALIAVIAAAIKYLL